MNMVYIRVALWIIGPLLGALPFAEYDAEAQTVTIALEELAIALGGGITVAGAVFGIWGKK